MPAGACQGPIPGRSIRSWRGRFLRGRGLPLSTSRCPWIPEGLPWLVAIELNRENSPAPWTSCRAAASDPQGVLGPAARLSRCVLKADPHADLASSRQSKPAAKKTRSSYRRPGVDPLSPPSGRYLSCTPMWIATSMVRTSRITGHCCWKDQISPCSARAFSGVDPSIPTLIEGCSFCGLFPNQKPSLLWDGTKLSAIAARNDVEYSSSHEVGAPIESAEARSVCAVASGTLDRQQIDRLQSNGSFLDAPLPESCRSGR